MTILTIHSMTTMDKRAVDTQSAARKLAPFLMGWVLLPVLTCAQTPTIQITSPTTGSIVAPGKTFAVSVTTGPGSTFTGVFAVEQDFALSPVVADAPFTFRFVAPGLIGPLTLTAVGIQGAGSAVFSQPVVVSVESTAALTELSVSPSQIAFSFAGQQLPLIVAGTFADGTKGDITHSANISYSSTDTTVAQVASSGIVTAVGPGTTGAAQIAVTYGSLSKNVKVSVPEAIRGDLNGDGKVDEDDLNIILSAVNTSATKPVDARDLNGDGVINALDARILVTLCTRAGCATH